MSSLLIFAVLHILFNTCIAAEKEYVSETLMVINKKIQNSNTPNRGGIYHHNCVSSSSHYMNQTYVEDIVARLRMDHTNFSTLVSARRLEASAYLLQAALLLRTGDIVETGIYMGGSSIVMLKLMKEFDLCNKHFWGFDSFIGLPPLRKEDKKLTFGSDSQMDVGFWASSEKTFIHKLKIHDVWNESTVHVVKGWFNETCRVAEVKQISFLRLDGDLFDSTWDAISALYKRVVPGGYIYVDDFGSFEGCRDAVNLFRQRNGIFEPLQYIRENNNNGKTPDLSIILFEAVWWQKRISRIY